MNEATILWRMEPGAPDVPLTLDELLGQPAWQARAPCQGQGAGVWVKAVGPAGD